jgi:hypothetical protein
VPRSRAIIFAGSTPCCYLPAGDSFFALKAWVGEAVTVPFPCPITSVEERPVRRLPKNGTTQGTTRGMPPLYPQPLSVVPATAELLLASGAGCWQAGRAHGGVLPR